MITRNCSRIHVTSPMTRFMAPGLATASKTGYWRGGLRRQAHGGTRTRGETLRCHRWRADVTGVATVPGPRGFVPGLGDQLSPGLVDCFRAEQQKWVS